MKRVIVICAIIFFLTTGVISQHNISNNRVYIGETENQEQVYVPSIAKEGPDGAIYVLDIKDSFIKVYSPNGKFLRKIGGEGYGPGLMGRSGYFGFYNAYTLFFTESINGNRWITLVNLSGQLVRVIKLDIPGQFGIWRSEVLPDGRIVAQIEKWGEYKKTGNLFVGFYPQWLAIISQEGKVTHSPIHKKLGFSITNAPNDGDCRIPFYPNFLWSLDKNNHIIFSDGTTGKFFIADMNGNPIGHIISALPDGAPVTKNDLDKWRKEKKAEILEKQGNEAYAKFYSYIEKYTSSIHKLKPIYNDLAITPEGNLLVAGDSNEKNLLRKYWLITPSGKTIKEITTTGVKSISISRQLILVIQENEEEENRVYCFPRKGLERDDLDAKNLLIE